MSTFRVSGICVLSTLFAGGNLGRPSSSMCISVSSWECVIAGIGVDEVFEASMMKSSSSKFGKLALG